MTITSSGWPVSGGAIPNGRLPEQQFSSNILKDGHDRDSDLYVIEQSPLFIVGIALFFCKTLVKCILSYI